MSLASDMLLESAYEKYLAGQITIEEFELEAGHAVAYDLRTTGEQIDAAFWQDWHIREDA